MPLLYDDMKEKVRDGGIFFNPREFGDNHFNQVPPVTSVAWWRSTEGVWFLRAFSSVVDADLWTIGAINVPDMSEQELARTKLALQDLAKLRWGIPQ